MSAVIRSSYTEDFAAWADQTAQAIEQGRFADLDAAALADEVRDWPDLSIVKSRASLEG